MTPYRRLLPFLAVAIFIAIWHLVLAQHPSSLVPRPAAVAAAIGELASKGLLVKYVVASLFRVTWGYLLGVAIAIPLGILLGLSRRGEAAFNPVIQLLRPISPLAWIPIAILWFGVGDLSAIFLILIASFLPMLAASMNAVRNVDAIYIHAGRNFGLSDRRMITSILVPAMMPEMIVALRLTLGISWLVVVAAEMIAVNSGLGFLIIEARNSGNRYDLVVAGMVLIGAIGLVLDTMMRRLERLDAVRWGYATP